jgi:hypothetical protein
MNKSQSDISLFRQAATAMSASILLIIIGSPLQVAYLGILFFCFSVVFLIATLGQIYTKWHKFPETIRKFGDGLTFSFILISLVAIIRGWASIIKALTENQTSTEPKIALIQSLSRPTILIWIYVFFILLFLFLIVDIYRGIRSTNKEFGARRTAIWYILAFCVTALWGIFMLLLPSNWTLFALCVLLTTGIIIYRNRDERRFYMERKDKARESAIAVTIMAKFIADSLTLEYPPETFKAILNVPLKQLEDEVQTLRAYVNALK